ncbi:MAG: hypothetical protein U5K43_01000 [Halofilum sp. (in: g-proteobacteria)]|nr:hypothetical protein [Halofilum sp. (in: g-proteobacteria)]
MVSSLRQSGSPPNSSASQPDRAGLDRLALGLRHRRHHVADALAQRLRQQALAQLGHVERHEHDQEQRPEEAAGRPTEHAGESEHDQGDRDARGPGTQAGVEPRQRNQRAGDYEQPDQQAHRVGSPLRASGRAAATRRTGRDRSV